MLNRRGSKSKDLADWSRLVAPNLNPSPPTAKVKLGAWSVSLIGVADESDPGIVVDCPADLLTLHAEIVGLFGAVQERFQALIEAESRTQAQEPKK